MHWKARIAGKRLVELGAGARSRHGVDHVSAVLLCKEVDYSHLVGAARPHFRCVLSCPGSILVRFFCCSWLVSVCAVCVVCTKFDSANLSSP